MRALRAAGEDRLAPAEEQQLREAADALLFCEDLDAGSEAKAALDGASDLIRRLATTRRWPPEAAEQLLEDLAGCGPVLLLV